VTDVFCFLVGFTLPLVDTLVTLLYSKELKMETIRIKIDNNELKDYKYLEKFLFEVIGNKDIKVVPNCNIYRDSNVETTSKKDGISGNFYNTFKVPYETITNCSILKVIGVKKFNLKFPTDCRLKIDKVINIAPIHNSYNPTIYDNNDSDLIGMELTLDLSRFMVIREEMV